MRRRVAAVAAAALLLAGCSAAADPVDTPEGEAPTASATEEATEEATEDATATALTQTPTKEPTEEPSGLSEPYPDRADQADDERAQLEDLYLAGLALSGSDLGGLSDGNLVEAGDAFCDIADDAGGEDYVVSWSLAVALDYDDLLDAASSDDVWDIATAAATYICPEHYDGLTAERGA